MAVEGFEPPTRLRPSRSRIMYVELKSGYNDNGPAWIGRVFFSKTGQTLYYRGMMLQRITGDGTCTIPAFTRRSMYHHP